MVLRGVWRNRTEPAASTVERRTKVEKKGWPKRFQCLLQVLSIQDIRRIYVTESSELRRSKEVFHCDSSQVVSHSVRNGAGGTKERISTGAYGLSFKEAATGHWLSLNH